MARKINLSKILKAIHTPHWLTIILLIIFIFRIPSFFEPYSYGDEMIYLTLGNAIQKGMVLFRDIHDNKPPLLYFTAAVAGNVFWFRVILSFWMMATTVFFWKLVNLLIKKNDLLVKVAVIAFAILTTIPLLEGQIANAELFMIGPTIIAFYVLLKGKLTPTKIIGAGMLFSISTLYKVPAAFDIGAILFYWVATTKLNGKGISRIITNTLLLLAGFLTPIILSAIWYSARGALNEYLVAAFLQNFGYLSSFRPDDVAEPFLVKNAPLIMRGFLMLLGLLALYVYRNKISKSFIFACAWLFVGLFAVTLSERPYPHYLIQVVPSISILVGFLVAAKTIEQSLTVIPLFIALFVPVYYKFWYYPSLPYYERFIRFATGMDSKEEYFNKFDGNVNRNYAVARFINESSKPDDKVFIWGDSSPIYALTKRFPPIKYVANYHINDFSSKDEVLSALIEGKPAFVVVLPDSNPFTELRVFLSANYFIIDSVEGAQIWRLMSPGVSKKLR